MSATPTSPNTPAETVETPAASEPELDVVSLLLPDSVEKPAAPAETPEPKDEAPATATDGDAAAVDSDGAGTETGEAQATDTLPAGDGGDGKPQQGTPGTPDKALQKLQQDFAATNRKLDALLAKADAPGGLTAQDKQAAQQAKRKLDSIREAIAAKGDDFDLLQHDQDIAASLIEHDDALTAAQAKNAELEKRLARIEQQHATTSEAQQWAAVGQKYPGVQVRPVWDKAVADAYAQIGVADAGQLPPDSPLHAAAENVANHLFHARADAASKAVKGRAAGAPKTPAPTPTGSARVTGTAPAQAHATGGQLSEDAQYEADALALVKT